MGSAFAKEKEHEEQVGPNLDHLNQLKFELELDVHAVPVDELCKRWNTNVGTGLSAAQAKLNIEEFGLNQLTPPPTAPEWVKFCKNLFCGYNMWVWIGATPFYIAYGAKANIFEAPPDHNLYLGVALTAVGVANGIFSYYQEYKSSMESSKKLADEVPLYALVRRYGEKLTIKAEELTMGDIVEVKHGDRVPADIRILESRQFKVDNSLITGESEPHPRSKEYTSPNALETENLAFFCTMAVDGTALGMVVNIGDNTAMGRLRTMAW